MIAKIIKIHTVRLKRLLWPGILTKPGSVRPTQQQRSITIATYSVAMTTSMNHAMQQGHNRH